MDGSNNMLWTQPNWNQAQNYATGVGNYVHQQQPTAATYVYPAPTPIPQTVNQGPVLWEIPPGETEVACVNQGTEGQNNKKGSKKTKQKKTPTAPSHQQKTKQKKTPTKSKNVPKETPAERAAKEKLKRNAEREWKDPYMPTLERLVREVLDLSKMQSESVNVGNPLNDPLGIQTDPTRTIEDLRKDVVHLTNTISAQKGIIRRQQRQRLKDWQSQLRTMELFLTYVDSSPCANFPKPASPKKQRQETQKGQGNRKNTREFMNSLFDYCMNAENTIDPGHGKPLTKAQRWTKKSKPKGPPYASAQKKQPLLVLVEGKKQNQKSQQMVTFSNPIEQTIETKAGEEKQFPSTSTSEQTNNGNERPYSPTDPPYSPEMTRTELSKEAKQIIKYLEALENESSVEAPKGNNSSESSVEAPKGNNSSESSSPAVTASAGDWTGNFSNNSENCTGEMALAKNFSWPATPPDPSPVVSPIEQATREEVSMDESEDDPLLLAKQMVCLRRPDTPTVETGDLNITLKMEVEGHDGLGEMPFAGQEQLSPVPSSTQ